MTETPTSPAMKAEALRRYHGLRERFLKLMADDPKFYHYTREETEVFVNILIEMSMQRILDERVMH